MTTTTNTTAPDALVTDLMDDLTGFHPALDRAVSGLGELITADLDADSSQSVIAALGGFVDGSFATLLGLVVRRLADPDVNAGLGHLDSDSKQLLRRLGAEYAAQADSDYQRDTASEISAVIDGA